MNNNVDTSLELFLQIVQGIEEPCEHSHHDQSRNHGGSGEWYVTNKPCPHCGVAGDRKLVCDKFMKYVFSGGGLKCGNCKKQTGNGMEAYSSVTRKEK